MKNTTLVHVIDREKGKILLARKNRGIGTGLWNGAGGHIEEGESPEAAAAREIKEEFGLDIRADELIPAAHLRFHFEQADWENFSFIADIWQGEPTEAQDKEMIDLTWFPLHEIPYKDMWADDIFWMPHALNGNFVRAEFWFTGNTVDKHIIHSIETL